MQDKLFRKGLVVGIFILFIGIAVAPSVNAINIKQNNVIQKTIDNSLIETHKIEDDCGCQDYNNEYLIKLDSSLNRIEILIKFISILFINNPDIKENYQKLSNEITAFREIREHIFPDYPPFICLSIIYMIGVLYFLAFSLGIWAERLGNLGFHNLKNFIAGIILELLNKCLELDSLYAELGCPPPFSSYDS